MEQIIFKGSPLMSMNQKNCVYMPEYHDAEKDQIHNYSQLWITDNLVNNVQFLAKFASKALNISLGLAGMNFVLLDTFHLVFSRYLNLSFVFHFQVILHQVILHFRHFPYFTNCNSLVPFNFCPYMMEGHNQL